MGLVKKTWITWKFSKDKYILFFPEPEKCKKCRILLAGYSCDIIPDGGASETLYSWCKNKKGYIPKVKI